MNLIFNPSPSISSAGNVAWNHIGEIYHCFSTQRQDAQFGAAFAVTGAIYLALPITTGVNKKWAGCTQAVFHWRKGTHTAGWREPVLFDGHAVMDLLHLKQSFISTLDFKKQQPVVHTPVICVIEFMTYCNVYLESGRWQLLGFFAFSFFFSF